MRYWCNKMKIKVTFKSKLVQSEITEMVANLPEDERALFKKIINALDLMENGCINKVILEKI